jgi:hypothetical protein
MLISKAFYRHLPIFSNISKCPLRGLICEHLIGYFFMLNRLVPFSKRGSYVKKLENKQKIVLKTFLKVFFISF